MRMKRHFTNSILMRAKHLQQPRHQRKGATFHGQTRPSVRWLKRKTLWAFVANCDFMNTFSIWCELWLHEHFQHLMRIVTSWTLWAFVANCDFMNTLSICCELWLHEHWAFVANCDFMNKNISAVTKLGTRILTLCCQKKVKYYMIQVCSVECNVLVQLQNLTFTTSVYLNVFFVLMSWTRSWSFFMHFRQNFVRTWVYKPISLCFSVPKINYLFLLKETLLKSWHPISHHTH